MDSAEVGGSDGGGMREMAERYGRDISWRAESVRTTIMISDSVMESEILSHLFVLGNGTNRTKAEPNKDKSFALVRLPLSLSFPLFPLSPPLAASYAPSLSLVH